MSGWLGIDRVRWPLASTMNPAEARGSEHASKLSLVKNAGKGEEAVAGAMGKEARLRAISSEVKV